MQLVVPSAVINAVSAATITFTAISIKRFVFIRYSHKFSIFNFQFSIRLIVLTGIVTVLTTVAARVSTAALVLTIVV